MLKSPWKNWGMGAKNGSAGLVRKLQAAFSTHFEENFLGQTDNWLYLGKVVEITEYY